MEKASQDHDASVNVPYRAQKQTLKRDVFALREEGRSLLPVSRVQRIIKADKELPIVAKEAVFAISVATEEFIKRMTTASQRQAERENRATVQRKDLVNIVERADEFFFLEDILTWSHEERSQSAKRSNRNVKEVMETEAPLLPGTYDKNIYVNGQPSST